MDVLAIGLALAFGFVLGVIVGARRSVNVFLSARAVRSAAARVASLSGETPHERTPADILAGRIRVTLGDETFVLPVLPRGPSRRWIEALDSRFAILAAQLEGASNDEVMAQLYRETDALYEMLLSYDQSHVLPDRKAIDETATDAQILHAVLEVWRAGHPLVDSVIVAAQTTAGSSSTPPSSSPMPTAGAPTTSTTG